MMPPFSHEHSEPSLSELMAHAARELQEQAVPDDVFASAVQLAVRDIDGCDAAALSIVSRRRKIDTPAATSDDARRGDELQYESREGPCLSAIWDQQTVHSPDLRRDERWPTWGPRMADEVGYQSMLVFQLFTNQDTLGALNLYSSSPDGFDDDDQDHGLALAAHIAVAVRSAQRIEQLSTALTGRARVALALGMAMERYDLTEEAAFALFTRLSSQSNTKLRDLAEEMLETRRLPGNGHAEQT